MFLFFVFVDPLLHPFWKLLIAFSVASRACDYLLVGDGRFCHGWIAGVVVCMFLMMLDTCFCIVFKHP